MKIIKDLKDVTPDLRGCIMTIGNFDGVHLAHQKIIGKVVEVAAENRTKSVVMTFEPHPQQVLQPDRIPFYLITTVDEKLEILRSLGVDAAVVIPFSREFSRTTAREFICGTIWEKLRPKKVLIGHDYTFGKGKEGKPEYLKSLGKSIGFEVEIIQAVEIEGGIISSTRIRNAILRGNIGEAALLLGRPYTLKGTVVEGFRRGTDLGFPTANLLSEKELIPGEGVYAVYAELDGKRLPAVVNIGFNPTFSNEKLSVEVHILDFSGDLYGKTLQVLFIEKIRDERKFGSLDELIEQIKKDILKARSFLK